MSVAPEEMSSEHLHFLSKKIQIYAFKEAGKTGFIVFPELLTQALPSPVGQIGFKKGNNMC